MFVHALAGAVASSSASTKEERGREVKEREEDVEEAHQRTNEKKIIMKKSFDANSMNYTSTTPAICRKF